MPSSGKPEEIIWAKWEVDSDGRVNLIATHESEGELRQWRVTYDSLEKAEAELGPGFADVVRRALEVESYRGRWRP